MIEYVNAGVGQTEVGVELGVGGIEQVGEQSQFVFIAVAYQPVVLVGQFHVFLLCLQVGKGCQEIDVVFLDGVVYLFEGQPVLFFGMCYAEPGLLHFMFVLEE